MTTIIEHKAKSSIRIYYKRYDGSIMAKNSLRHEEKRNEIRYRELLIENICKN